MHMAKTKRRWTFAEFQRLPEDSNKYEFVHGELFVTPAPTFSHETIVARLTHLLVPYVIRHRLGLVFHPRGVFRIGRVVEVEPDLMVRHPAPPGTEWENVPRPILVVEVASDSTRRRDRIEKRDVYVDAGIEEYWIMDGKARTICVVRPKHEDVVVNDTLTWHPGGATEPLTFSLVDVFGTATEVG